MTRTNADRGGAVLAFIVVITVNALANILPINGQNTGEVSASYPSLFTPAGYTFSIWGLIYLSLAAYVVYQALPAQRANQALASVNKLLVINCLLNAAWIFAWHYELIALSLLLMFAMLATLVNIDQILRQNNTAPSWAHRCFVSFPFSLYYGWICVAAIANISAGQTGMGWDEAGLSAVNWTLLKLALAGAVAAIAILRRGDIAFGLVVAWAAIGIVEKQQATQAVAGAAATLAALVLILVVLEVFKRLKGSKP